MRYTVQYRLRSLGCKSVPAERPPISFGAGFLRAKEIERHRKSNEEFRARKEASRIEEKQRWDADTERLKELGGRNRSQEENREWYDIFSRRPGRSMEYFEKRGWEKKRTTTAA